MQQLGEGGAGLEGPPAQRTSKPRAARATNFAGMCRSGIGAGSGGGDSDAEAPQTAPRKRARTAADPPLSENVVPVPLPEGAKRPRMSRSPALPLPLATTPTPVAALTLSGEPVSESPATGLAPQTRSPGALALASRDPAPAPKKRLPEATPLSPRGAAMSPVPFPSLDDVAVEEPTERAPNPGLSLADVFGARGPPCPLGKPLGLFLFVVVPACLRLVPVDGLCSGSVAAALCASALARPLIRLRFRATSCRVAQASDAGPAAACAGSGSRSRHRRARAAAGPSAAAAARAVTRAACVRSADAARGRERR